MNAVLNLYSDHVPSMGGGVACHARHQDGSGCDAMRVINKTMGWARSEMTDLILGWGLLCWCRNQEEIAQGRDRYSCCSPRLGWVIANPQLRDLASPDDTYFGYLGRSVGVRGHSTVQRCRARSSADQMRFLLNQRSNCLGTGCGVVCGVCVGWGWGRRGVV